MYVDPEICRGDTDLYPSRTYTRTVTRAIEESHAASRIEFQYEIHIFADLTAEVYYSCFLHIMGSLPETTRCPEKPDGHVRLTL